jgi:hypothetical protein
MKVHDTIKPDLASATEEYARRFAGPVGEFFLEIQDTALRHLLCDLGPGSGRVLLVGGGHGQLLNALLVMGYEVCIQGSGITCQDRLREMRAGQNGQLTFVVSSLWSLPFDDRTFDLVIGIRLLAHVTKWRQLVAEMARVSANSIVLDYPPVVSANLLSSPLFPLKNRLEGNSTRPYFCYRTAPLRLALEAAGFSITGTRRQLLMPMVIHRAIGIELFSRTLERLLFAIGITTLLGSPALLMAKRTDA